MDAKIICDIISIIFKGGWIKRKKPYGCYAKILQIIQFFYKPLKISNPIGIAVVKCPYVKLIDNDVLVPEGFIREPDSIKRHAKSPYLAISQISVVITTTRDIMLKPYECEKQNPKHGIHESTQSGF
jgi:hypothetical protein